MLMLGLAVFAAFLLGLRVGIAVGHRTMQTRLSASGHELRRGAER